VTLKEAEVALAGMATDAGRERAEEALLTVTEAPEAGALFVRVTVQEVLAFDERLEVAHWSPEIRVGETSPIEAVAEDPFRATVIVTV
jgi:hypothetical protein